MCQGGWFTECQSLIHEVSVRSQPSNTYYWRPLLKISGNLVVPLALVGSYHWKETGVSFTKKVVLQQWTELGLKTFCFLFPVCMAANLWLNFSLMTKKAWHLVPSSLERDWAFFDSELVIHQQDLCYSCFPSQWHWLLIWSDYLGVSYLPILLEALPDFCRFALAPV